ncbi:polysaccharide biosynthesis tyrosine autokinase [Ramlibacter sp. WS9]|uniref:polysaccharide biosynthesis tyrosine autokinase n=1 Tax=Ramlibacter sp. WS9 TaxID=1882741 RepID=UPI00130519F0|nr:polysaccharide biosynthesis tyrosine autokinase [Ramlibacter sp. WS9]
MYFSEQDVRPAHVERQSESSLLEVMDALGDSKWAIAAITCAGIAAALLYIVAVPPTYEASALVQVEEVKAASAGMASAYTEAASLFENRSPAVAEISILRSGPLLLDVVDRLGLDISARPRYLPVIGEWLGRRATAPSRPGFLETTGYVHGNESIQVTKFVVPREREGEPFSVLLTATGYELRDPLHRLVLKGTPGKLENFGTGTGTGQILVASVAGRSGAEFRVEKLGRSAVIEKLQRRLKIEEQGKQSGMLRVRLAGSDPEMVAKTVNQIAESYLRQNLERKTAEAERALEFVEGMLPHLRNEITQAEAKLNRFRSRNTGFEITAKGKLALDQSVRAETTLHELQTRRRELAANALGNEHPRMQALDAQITAATAELGSVNRRIRVLPPKEQETLGMSRELKVKSDLYVSLLNSAQQIQLAKDGKVANIRVVDPAWPPQEPAGPMPAALLAAGTTGGMVLGVLFALLRKSVRRGVQEPDWIESHSAMSVLTTVPFSKAQKLLARPAKGARGGARVLALHAPQDPAVESLRSMRTALQRKMPTARSNIVLITGPTHGIGKSFTSMNLAAVLAASGRRVLIIDADMRKGHLHDAFGVPAAPGLSDMLMGLKRLGNAVHRNVVPNVDFIAAGSPTPTPADLVTTRTAELLLAEASAAYDYVVLDTPPVLATSEAAILAQWAGAVFLIARAEVTSLRELHESEKRLSQRGIEVDGVIYTGVDGSKRRNAIYSYGSSEYLSAH